MIWTLSCHSQHISTNMWLKRSELTPFSTPSTIGSLESFLRNFSSTTLLQIEDIWEKEQKPSSFIHFISFYFPDDNLFLMMNGMMKVSLTEDGSWLKPPPNYPPIASSQSSSPHNLEEYISMEAETGLGDVLSLTEFVKKFHLNTWVITRWTAPVDSRVI